MGYKKFYSKSLADFWNIMQPGDTIDVKFVADYLGLDKRYADTIFTYSYYHGYLPYAVYFNDMSVGRRGHKYLVKGWGEE